MKLETGRYKEIQENLPQSGQYIVAHQTPDKLVVYQAYNPLIADYAVRTQTLDGPHFSYDRMSWIKPNFLWMMYRSGWATKTNQERILAIWITKNVFESILREAVFSSYQPVHYPSREVWEQELAQKEVRIQWDPDHDPVGNKLSRRALQIGMKGQVLKRFGKEQIDLIEDITPFVAEQRIFAEQQEFDRLIIPTEQVLQVKDEALYQKLAVQK